MSATNPTLENPAGFRLAVVVEGALGLVALGLAWLCGVSLRDQFGTTAWGLVEGAFFGAVATLPMLALFWWLLEAPWRPFVELKTQVASMVRELFPRARTAELAIIAILAGVSEELLFRGVLQTVAARWTTPIVGLAIASLVFGGLHAVSRLYFILATVIGVYLGWLHLECNDLTVPIVAHALYDFVALTYLTKIESKRLHSE